jgi:heme exporter protein A
MPWILDEPYDALDAAGIAALDGLLSAHLARGGSIILTSHQALAAMQGVARIWRLDARGLTDTGVATA